MELTIIKSRPISIFLLLLLLLYVPHFSIGSFVVSDNEVYEIDYRGPETHSSTPPPGHGHGHWVHKETDLPLHASSKGLRVGNNKGRKANNVHG